MHMLAQKHTHTQTTHTLKHTYMQGQKALATNLFPFPSPQAEFPFSIADIPIKGL